MGRRAFIISLLAFLGFVILQTVSAEERSEELAAELNYNTGSLLEPSENHFRLIRSPDADTKKREKQENVPKKTRGGKGTNKGGRRPYNKNGKKVKGTKRRRPRWKKSGNGKKTGGKGKGGKKGGQGGKEGTRPGSKKRYKKRGKGGKKGGKGGGRPNNGNNVNVLNVKTGGKQACDEQELCKRIKLYIKYSNQQRKAKRILRTCKTMKNKHDKAGTEFEATAAAIKDSDDTNVTAIQAVLEKCKTTAKAVCALTNVAECADAEQTKINGCITKLKAWIDAFGPGTKSCLGQENCCSCINGIEPPVPDECLSYDETDKKSLGKKNMCTKSESGGGGTGSFGECRKKQQAAAEQGPPAFGKKCKNGGMTTAKPSGRRRKAVLKIRKELNIKK